MRLGKAVFMAVFNGLFMVLFRPLFRPVRRRSWAPLLRTTGLCLCALSLSACWQPSASERPEGRTVKIAFIDPLTGPSAAQGKNQLLAWQFFARQKSGLANPAEVDFEVVGFDNKGSPHESIKAVKVAIDQGFRYLVQGQGAGAAQAISDAVLKHNRRHPERRVLFLNHGATDPSLTNERCHPWHVRIDADSQMRTLALLGFLVLRPDIKKLFLVIPDDAPGHQAGWQFKQQLLSYRPDMALVGEASMGVVTDVAALAERVRQTGADAVVSAAWGPRLNSLLLALDRLDKSLAVFAQYPAVTGTPEAMADLSGRLQVYQVAHHHSRAQGALGRLASEFKARHGQDLHHWAPYNGLLMLSKAMAKALSTDPGAVAMAVSGLQFEGSGGTHLVRAVDHQLLMGVWVSRWQAAHLSGQATMAQTRYAFEPVWYADARHTSAPSACDMHKAARDRYGYIP